MNIPFFKKNKTMNTIINAPEHLSNEEKTYVHDATISALNSIYKNKNAEKYIMDYTSCYKFSDGANLYVLEELKHTHYKEIGKQLYHIHFPKMYKDGEITIFTFGVNYCHRLEVIYSKNTKIYDNKNDKFYSCNLFRVDAPIEKLHDTMITIHETLFEFVNENRK